MKQQATTAHDLQVQAAEKHLHRAAHFAALHATAKPLFLRRMGRGKQAVIVRLDWPGVLTVADPETGRVLAASEPGRPDVLASKRGGCS